MKLNEKYSNKIKTHYTVEKLYIDMDFSEGALEEALIRLNFKLGEYSEYVLYLGRENLREILKMSQGYNLFNISVELQEDLRDEWYLVDEVSKTIIYSEGA